MLPAKVLIFHEDARPGYYSFWTKNSRIVGPRSPFARDLLARDYGYDSGEEWEDEGAADADNVDDYDNDEGDGEECDSDLESWQVDDDEIEEVVPDDRDLSPSLLDLPPPPPKRKAEPLSKQPEKKRKIVVPLVPYMKDPLWESIIGQCE
jgi:chromatin assembly factor 1 subunit A